jgi:hypothetical protein
MSPRLFGKVLLASLAVVAGAGAFVHLTATAKPEQQISEPAVNLPTETWNIGSPAATAPTVDARTLRHDQPPPLEALRDVNAQAQYDAAAKPGDFVTPPIISQPH